MTKRNICKSCNTKAPIVWRDWDFKVGSIGLCYNCFVTIYPEQKSMILRKCIVCINCHKKFIANYGNKCGCHRNKTIGMIKIIQSKPDPQTKLLEMII